MATATAHQIIIPVFTGVIRDEQSQLVDARAIHSFLESKRQFGNWIKTRIEQYGFAEGVDFFSFNKIVKRATGASKATEYHVTLDMAKELSMVERNEKGQQARRYFIECEKRLRQIAPDDADTIQEMTIGTRGFQCLKGIVDGKVGRLPRENRRGAKIHLWQQVHKAFSVISAEDIPAERMSDARNFVAAYALEGEYLAAIQDDDHITINLPKAPDDQFDKLPAVRLFGCDVAYCSKLNEMFCMLRNAAKNEQYVRVIDIEAAAMEVSGLRHHLTMACSALEDIGRQTSGALRFRLRPMY